MDEFDPTLDPVDEELAQATAQELVDDLEEEVPPRPEGFIVTEGAYGPGTVRVQLASGVPVGIWLDKEHPNVSGAMVTSILMDMGLDEENAARFGRQRQKRLDGEVEVAKLPAVAGMIAYEAERERQLVPIRKAFVDAQRKKQK